jgi:hypothetical protein
MDGERIGGSGFWLALPPPPMTPSSSRWPADCQIRSLSASEESRQPGDMSSLILEAELLLALLPEAR